MDQNDDILRKAFDFIGIGPEIYEPILERKLVEGTDYYLIQPRNCGRTAFREAYLKAQAILLQGDDDDGTKV